MIRQNKRGYVFKLPQGGIPVNALALEPKSKNSYNGAMKKQIALLTGIAFLLVTTLGLGLNTGLHAKESMPECDTMQNESVMCPLNAQERLEKWQGLSAVALSSFKTPLASLFALAIILIYLFPLGIKKDPGLFAHVPLGPPLRHRIRLSTEKNHIRQALSQGLLNPQID